MVAEYDEERPARRLGRRLDLAIGVVALVGALVVIRQVFFPISQGNQFYLIVFLALVLPLTFLCYRPGVRRRHHARTAQDGPTADDGSDPGDHRDDPGIADWVLAVAALLVCLYPVLPVPGGGFDAFLDRQGSLGPLDVTMGAILLVLVVEACRRTTGPMLPVVALAFLAYAYYGGFLPVTWPVSHAGLDFDQIVNALYNDASGFFGTPLDVCATYIVLFTIYGAVLDRTGAGRFFIELSFSLFKGSRTAPGRTVALSGFLLGTVSGSGTATAVSLGSVAWPTLRRAGYPADQAGGMLAASGIGAILSPPTLGAAAFIIAEYLQVSYLDVLIWAIVPTLLYYLGIALAVEIDARRFGARAVDVPSRPTLWLLGRFGYHFVSLGVIVLFLALDIPPVRAVVYATAVAAVFGLVERLLSRRADPFEPAGDGREPVRTALRGYAVGLGTALSTGVRAVLPVAAVCATAGVVTATITKTGLGQTLADLLVTAARALTDNPTAVLVVTAVFAAVAILLLGMAVPVTASFIISWVVIGPALLDLGVSAPETAMFIFYYAVLSEVSPPTALAAVASAALTGGDVVRTMLQACKYTLPAFLVPVAFVITDNGANLLWRGDLVDVAWTFGASALAVAALAVVTGGWITAPAGVWERLLCVPAAAFLLYLHPTAIAVGSGFLALAVAVHLIRVRVVRPAPLTEGTPQ
ncbi:MAG TPA: TRAP transporter fused permease subunit [Pseudonocardiaceae bacterium]